MFVDGDTVEIIVTDLSSLGAFNFDDVTGLVTWTPNFEPMVPYPNLT